MNHREPLPSDPGYERLGRLLTPLPGERLPIPIDIASSGQWPRPTLVAWGSSGPASFRGRQVTAAGPLRNHTAFRARASPIVLRKICEYLEIAPFIADVRFLATRLAIVRPCPRLLATCVAVVRARWERWSIRPRLGSLQNVGRPALPGLRTAVHRARDLDASTRSAALRDRHRLPTSSNIALGRTALRAMGRR
jgi:hypothetical protein